MDDTSKNDSLKLASQIAGNCGDNPREEFHSNGNWGSHQLQLLNSQKDMKEVPLFAKFDEKHILKLFSPECEYNS